MKIFLWTILAALSVGHCGLLAAKREHLAVKDPATARDLRGFYRSIQALSADSVLNGTAIAIV